VFRAVLDSQDTARVKAVRKRLVELTAALRRYG
jgi:hypothetical protein